MFAWFLVGVLATASSQLGPAGQAGQPLPGLPAFDREQGTAFPWQLTRPVIADGSVWVGSAQFLGMIRTEDYHLYRVEAATGRMVASTVLPHLPVQLAAGAGSVWVVEQAPTPAYKTSVKRYDGTSLRLTGELPFGKFPGAKVAFGAGSLWVWDGELLQGLGVKLGRRRASCYVARVDPRTHQEVARIPLPDLISKLVVGEGAVWALGSGLGAGSKCVIYCIDPQTNKLIATIPVDRTTTDMAVGEGHVWLIHTDLNLLHPLRDNLLTRIDVRTHARAGTPVRLQSGGVTIAVGRGAVWIAAHSNAPNDGLLRLDPHSGERLGEFLIWPHPEVAAGDSGVWVSGYDPFEPNMPPKLKLRSKEPGFLHRLAP